jgi:hypothetical protein
MITECLILLDTDKVKDYVFATGKLKEIRGSSFLLDELNESETERLRQDAINRSGKKIEMLYAGGGSAKLISDDKDTALQFAEAVEAAYRAKTHTSSISCAVTKRQQVSENGTTRPETFHEWLDRAERALRQKKDGRAQVPSIMTAPYLKFCESCAMQPATIHYTADPNDIALICDSCNEKRQASEKSRRCPQGSVHEKFLDFKGELKDQQGYSPYLFARDMHEIGVGSAPPVKDYIGFVYADGNRMGEHLQLLLKDEKDDTKAKELLSRFSRAVKCAINEALAEAACAVITHKLERKGRRRDGTTVAEEYYPLEFTVTGGDDLIAIVPGDAALDFSSHLCQFFQRKFEDSEFYKAFPANQQPKHRLSLSVGVVLAHDNFPIKNLLDLATDLQKSAKRLSRALHKEANKEWKKAGSSQEDLERALKRLEVNTIDFMLVTGSGSPPVKYVRDHEMAIGYAGERTHLLTCRPYTDEEFDQLLCDIRALKRTQFPKTKLNTVYEALYTTPAQATLEILYLWARLSTGKKSREVFRQCMTRGYEEAAGLGVPPWLSVRYPHEVYPELSSLKHCTRLLDVVEAYSFVKEASGPPPAPIGGNGDAQ